MERKKVEAVVVVVVVCMEGGGEMEHCDGREKGVGSVSICYFGFLSVYWEERQYLFLSRKEELFKADKVLHVACDILMPLHLMHSCSKCSCWEGGDTLLLQFIHTLTL